MAKKKNNTGLSDAPDADRAFTVEALAALEEQLTGDADGDADVDADDNDGDGPVVDDGGDPSDFDADLAELERDNAALLDKADPPSAEPKPAPPKVDPVVEREKLVAMLLPEVRAQWSHLELKSVGRQTVDVKLTDAERLETAHKIADVRRRLAALESREARLKAAVKAARAVLETEQGELYDRFDKGSEERALHVATFLDFAQNRAVTVRQDTAAIVSERALTVEERQLTLLPRPVERETTATGATGATGA